MKRSYVLLSVIVLLSLKASIAQVTVTQTGFYTAPDGAILDQLGISVSLVGHNALVGAPQGGNGGNGYAYLYDTTTGQQVRKFVSPSGHPSDQFGYMVTQFGNNALISSHYETIGSIPGQGAAYLFDTSTGLLKFKLTASDGSAASYFSWNAVTLSSTTAVIGAIESSINGNIKQGSAYLFDTATGQQTAKLVANDGVAGDRFGTRVAISGNTAIVTADQFFNGGVGSAYVFDATTGQQLRKLTASDGATNDYFGTSISLSGNLALIGAQYNDIGGNADQGSVYLFDVTTGQQLYQFTASDGTAGDYFGGSVSISGNYAFITANGADVGSNVDQGKAYVFDLTTKQQLAVITAAAGASNDRFGWSISSSGDDVLIGVISDNVGGNSEQGSAYLYKVAAAAPEPSTIALLALGSLLGGLLLWVRKN